MVSQAITTDITEMNQAARQLERNSGSVRESSLKLASLTNNLNTLPAQCKLVEKGMPFRQGGRGPEIRATRRCRFVPAGVPTPRHPDRQRCDTP